MPILDLMYFQSPWSHVLSLISLNKFIYTFLCGCICTDVSVGPEGTCIISGLLRAEEGLQTQESGDRIRAEEGGMPQTGEPAKESKILK